MIATDLWWWNATSIGHTASKKEVTNCACWWWEWGGFDTRVQHPATFMKFNWIASHTVGKLWEIVDLDKNRNRTLKLVCVFWCISSLWDQTTNHESAN